MRRFFKKAVALALAAAMMIPVTGISAKAANTTSITPTKTGRCRYNYDKDSGAFKDAPETNNNASDTNYGDSWQLEYNTEGARFAIATYFDLSTVDASKPVQAATVTFTADMSSTKTIGVYGLSVTDEWKTNDTFAEYESKNSSPIRTILVGDSATAINNAVFVTNEDGTVTVSFDVTENVATLLREGTTEAGYAIATKESMTAGSRVKFSSPKLTIEYKPTYTIRVDETDYTAAYNSKVTLSASLTDADGQKFNYWMKNGKPVSYNQDYSFYVCEDATVTAVYGASAPETKKACYYLTYGPVAEDDAFVIVAECNFPTNVTGTIALSGNTKKPSDEKVTSTSFVKDSSASGDNQYKLTLTKMSNFNADNYDQLRVKAEGWYTVGETTKYAFPTGTTGGINLWFKKEKDTDKIDVGAPANAQAGVQSSEF